MGTATATDGPTAEHGEHGEHGHARAGETRPARLARARSAVVWLLLAEIAVLALSGLYLFFEYRPSSPGVLRDVVVPDQHVAHDVIRIHQVAAWAALVTATLGAGLLLWTSGPVRWGRLARGAALPVLAGLGLLTGRLLPWDQIALRQVTVGTSYAGYDWLGSDEVLFVLQGGSEVSPTTLLTVLVLHLVLGGGLLAVALLSRGGR